MHVFRQVFIADLISSRRADRGGAVCLFLFCFLTLQRAPPSVLGRMWGRQQRARGQPALINNHLLCASAVTICRGFLLLPESMTLCCAGAAAGALPPCWCLPDLPPSSYLNRIWAKKNCFLQAAAKKCISRSDEQLLPAPRGIQAPESFSFYC